MADPKTPPQGYDRYCDQCRQPYTFSNAKAVRTLNWRRFCSPGCERGDTFRRTPGVQEVPRG